MDTSNAVVEENQEFEAGIQDVAPVSVDFTLERSLILKALSHVQSVVEKRGTIPILSNVKLDASDCLLDLTATDTDISVTEQIPADVKEQGALTVPAHTLYEIVRKLPDGAQIQIKTDSKKEGYIQVKSGSSKFSLPTLPVSDFPVMDQGDMSHDFTLAPAELISLIDKTKFAVSTEETRYYLNGIYLHSIERDNEDSTLAAVATDGHRLAKYEITLPEGACGIPGIIIPRKAIAEVRKLSDEAGDEINISLSDTKICFKSGSAVLLSKLIDGTFPEYQNVIPKDNDKELEVNTKELVKSVDRVSTMASEKTRAIKLNVDANKVAISASNEDSGSANEELEASYAADPIESGFNSRYMLEMLSEIEGENTKILFSEGGAPALVKDTADSGSLYVIMPMRV